MITYLSRKHMGYDDRGRQILRIYIAVASSSELPTKYGISGIAIHEASIAWDVSTGKKYGFLDTSGWTEQPGSTLENPLVIKGRVNSVSDLPSDAEPGWLYYVGLATEENLPEYVYTADGNWDQVGTNTVIITIDSSLSDTSENPVQNKVVTSALNGKVSTESGKGLSSNDYTTAEKNKLAGLENFSYAILTQAQYDALQTKDKDVYFIYEV